MHPQDPLRVTIVVYDLLPPSRLASILNFVGTGVYHSSVQLSLPLGPSDDFPSPAEYAFGGHDSPTLTGIFSIPAGTAAQRMPGLRYYLELDAGEAFGHDWDRAFGPQSKGDATQQEPRKEVRRMGSKRSLFSGRNGREGEGGAGTLAGPPYGGWQAINSHSTATLATLASSLDGSVEDPFTDPDPVGVDDDGGASDGTEYMTKAQRRAWSIIQQMKNEEEWRGTKYKLLERNCNTFTDELVYRLTGRRAPAWLNRAAWVATSLPCIVPSGWVDDADEAAPTAESTSSVRIADPAHLVSREGSVTIEPPRADRMDLGGRT
ncbi:hypothetical protein JCM21900_000771 [Sporobolomyces salmonicolor]